MRFRFLGAIVSGILLAGAAAFTLLDAFTLQRPLESLGMTAAAMNSLSPPSESVNPLVTYAAPTPTPAQSQAASHSPSPTPETTPEPPVWNSAYAPSQEDEPLAMYDDGEVYIEISKAHAYGSTFFVAHVMLKDVTSLQAAFAGGTYGRNYTEHTSDIADENGAIFAVSGDYYGFRDEGFVLRNGVLHRGLSKKNALAIMGDGSMRIVSNKEHDAVELLNQGAWQGLEFGPAMVADGAATGEENAVSRKDNPRCAIGQIAPLDYLFVVVEGRSEDSAGVKCAELAEFFIERGCDTAYNLDGGGSATMYYMGEILNEPTYGGERRISDILFVANPDSGEGEQP